MAGRGGGNVEAGGVDVQLFGEEQARKLASSMGVQFVSGEAFTANGSEGYRAHYAFDDIRKVQLNADEATPAPMADAGAGAERPPFTFGFARNGETSVLTIQMPQRDGGMPAGLPQLPGAAGNNPQENAQAMAMMAMMMRGLFVDVSLAVEGKVVQSTEPLDGSKLTLLQLDMDQLLSADGALQKLQQLKDPKALKDLPGVKMVTAPVIKVEFAR
jgi:hypothetical protein